MNVKEQSSNDINSKAYEQNRNSYGAVNRNRKQYILDGEMCAKQIEDELQVAQAML